jgi:ketosteroid isomerase-like protein
MSSEPEAAREEVSRVLAEINTAWVEGRLDDLARHLDPEIAMALPEFSGTLTGKDAFLQGFREFLDSARVLAFDLSDRSVDLCGAVAVASFRYALLYEQGGATRRATGRDLWVFAHRGDGGWLAVWRTMMDVSDSALNDG